MKKIKQVFPSRNYITIDSYGDVEVIFNPVGDGFEGDDKLMFRKGRWAFRVNDFLSGKVMADGSKEGMGRKVYSLNLVYDDNDGEPIVNTTYVDPTSVIPLDGSVVDVVGSEKFAQETTLQSVGTDVKKLAQETTLQSVKENQEEIKSVLTSDIYNKIGAVEKSVDTVNSNIDNIFDDDTGYAMRSQLRDVVLKIEELKDLMRDCFIAVDGDDEEYVGDTVSYILDDYRYRFSSKTVKNQGYGANLRYSAGTVIYFGSTRFISLRSDCISISVGNDFLLLGDMSEYNNGTVKRLDGVKFASSDVTKILA